MDKLRNQSPATYGRIVYTLKDYLQCHDITLAELAARTQMNPWVLQQAIDGKTWPSRQHIARVCWALGIQPAALIQHVPA